MSDSNIVEYDDLLCPITHQIFYNPVVASDGFTYEESALKKWFKKNDRSPITNQKLSSLEYAPSWLTKSFVRRYLEQNPEKIDDQYQPDMTFVANKDDILEYIKRGEYEKLMLYHDYDLPYILYKIAGTPIKNNIKVMKYIIDHSVNHDEWYNGCTSIHNLVGFYYTETIKYFLRRYPDTDLNVICYNKSSELYGFSTFALICKYKSYRLIEWTIKRFGDKIDWEFKHENGVTLMNLIYERDKICKRVIKHWINLIYSE